MSLRVNQALLEVVVREQAPLHTMIAKFEVQWDGTTWIDETDYLISASGALELAPPHEAYQSARHIIQQATVVLWNHNLRYSAYNTVSGLYNHIRDGKAYHKRARLWGDVGDGWEIIFSGYIKLPREVYGQNQITLTVYDAGEVLRKKYSTGILRDMLEHEVVIHYLLLAGLTDGVDFISPDYALQNNVAATIDYSSQRIPFSWLDDESIWDELSDIAQASGARIYIAPEGKVRFEKGWVWATVPARSETLTVNNLADFQPYYDDNAFFDKVTVEFSDRIFGMESMDLWEMPRSKIIYPGQTETITARLRWPALAVAAPVINDDYYIVNAGGIDISAQVVQSFAYYAQQVEMTFTNNSTDLAILTQFTLKGYGLLGQPAEQTTVEVDVPQHGRTLDIRANPYVQTLTQAKHIAGFLAWWYAKPKMVIPVRGLRGVPSRRLGDRVTINVDTPILTRILRIEWQLSVLENRAVRYGHNLVVIEDGFTSYNYFIVGVTTTSNTHVAWH